MTVTGTKEFDIKATPADVMAAIVAVEDLPGWSGPHKSVTVETRFDDGRPHRVRADVSAVGFTDHQITDYTWNGDDSMSWSLQDSTLQAVQEGTYRLTPTAKGTHVHFDLALKPKIPLPGFVVKKVLSIAMDTASKGLTKFVESR
jgi:uncharacterized protein YndB with AHSA1/START domain